MDAFLDYIDDAIFAVSNTIPGAALLTFCATLMCIMGILMLAAVGALWVLPVLALVSAGLAFIQWDTQIIIRRPVVRIYVGVNPAPKYGAA